MLNDFNYFKKLKEDFKNNPMSGYKYFDKIEITNREYFKCLPKTEYIHKRLKKLFDNLLKEDYLKSGIKKQSYISNAKTHLKNNYFFLIDITNFFPSITKKYIKKELILTYKQSNDVAEFISNALTAPQKKANNQRALVTGSPISQFFSYVINKKMFDELEILAKNYGVKFSLYVDDISFSSNKIISHDFLQKVFYIIKSNGYEISKNKPDKKKFYRGKIGINSIITGIVMSKDGIFIPKLREKRIENQIEELKNIHNSSDDFKKLYDKTISSIQQAIVVNDIYKKYLLRLNDIGHNNNY